MVNRIYFAFHEGVHKELSDKHDWFVRYRNDNKEEFLNPYYVDGEIGDVIYDAIEDRENIALEVANNEWVRNPSVDIPCQYNVMVIDGVVLITHSYMDERLEDYGYKRGDKWLFRRFWNHKTLNYVHWSLPDSYLGEDLIVHNSKDKRKLGYNGQEFKVHSGGSMSSNGTTTVLGEKLPYDEKQEIVIPVINDMRHKDWKGRHEDIVQHLMEICDVRETEVKSR